LSRRKVSLHEDLLWPYPVYTPEETRLLPLPQRLGANPQNIGQGITLAFIDAGFYPHPDLVRPRNRILCFADAIGAQVVEKEDFRQAQDSSWHDLMTSCIAAGNGLRSAQVYRGVASRANLMLVKAGNLYNPSIWETDIERALAWVVANQQRFNLRIIEPAPPIGSWKKRSARSGGA
jgi:serine protease AprX